MDGSRQAENLCLSKSHSFAAYDDNDDDNDDGNDGGGEDEEDDDEEEDGRSLAGQKICVCLNLRPLLPI